jgi:GAF domain-containing protein
MLYAIGIPHAILWGVLSTLLRFIPFLGPWIAACFPVALAAAVDPGWSKLIYAFGIYLGMEIITPNVIEPWLYGASTGISNLALLVAAVFWTWLWGTPGLFLSTPLTVCILVIGKHVPGLQFLSVLLGSEPVLDPAARFYQRMLSMDAAEMLTMAKEFIRERSLEEFYNDVFVPALFMSEQDRHGGTLAEVRQKFIFETSRELIEELERDSEKAAATETGSDEKPVVLRKQEDDRVSPAVIYGMAGRDDADEVVALMLQHLLRIRGMETEVIPVTVHAEDYASWIQRNQVKVAYISALPPSALVGARQLVRRLRENCPNTKVLVGVWDHDANYDELTQRLRRPRPHAIVTNLGDAVRQIEKLLNETNAPLAPETAEEKAAEEAEASIEQRCRELEISPLGLVDADTDDLMGTLTRDLALHFNVPISLITISANEEPFWKTRLHVPPEMPSESPSGVMTNTYLLPEEAVMVEDITKDRRFATTNTLTERGVRFYAAVPLRNRAGRLVGGISVVDTKPRPYNERDKEILATRAAEFMEAVEALEQRPQAASTPPFPPRAEPSPAENV